MKSFTLFFALATNLWAANSQPLDFDRLVELMEKNKVTTVARAIEVIAEKYPEHANYYRVMRDSASFQRGERILLTGKDMDFTISFTPRRSQSGGGALETMSFDKANDKFIFREIQFDAETDKDQRLTKDEVAKQYRGFRVGHKNPDKCKNCHGMKDPRPNWESYNIWHRSLGGLNGASKGDRGYLKVKDDHPDREEEFLKKFERMRKSNRRLMALRPFEEFKKTDGLGGEDANKLYNIELNKMNSRRLARIIAKEPRLSSYKLAILGAFFCPTNDTSEFLKEFLGEEQVKKLGETFQDYTKFEAKHHVDSRNYNLEKLRSVASFLGPENIVYAKEERFFPVEGVKQ